MRLLTFLSPTLVYQRIWHFRSLCLCLKGILQLEVLNLVFFYQVASLGESRLCCVPELGLVKYKVSVLEVHYFLVIPFVVKHHVELDSAHSLGVPLVQTTLSSFIVRNHLLQGRDIWLIKRMLLRWFEVFKWLHQIIFIWVNFEHLVMSWIKLFLHFRRHWVFWCCFLRFFILCFSWHSLSLDNRVLNNAALVCPATNPRRRCLHNGLLFILIFFAFVLAFVFWFFFWVLILWFLASPAFDALGYFGGFVGIQYLLILMNIYHLHPLVLLQTSDALDFAIILSWLTYSSSKRLLDILYIRKYDAVTVFLR